MSGSLVSWSVVNAPPQVRGLMAAPLPGWNGTNGIVWPNGAPFVVNYSFARDPEAGTSPANFRAFSAQQQEAARQAIQLWAQPSGLVAVEVPDRPGGAGIDIRFSLETLPAGVAATGSAPQAGAVRLSLERFGADPLQQGSIGYLSLVQEIGHAIGLKFTTEQTAGNDFQLGGAQDTWRNTVMSRNATGQIPSTLGPFDLDAVRFVYGDSGLEPSWARSATYDAATGLVRLTGDDNAETIIGTTSRGNLVDARGGDDKVVLGTLEPGDVGHIVFLGAGNDEVSRTGTGSSRVWGGDGDDRLYLGYYPVPNAGNFAWGEAGNDIIAGGSGPDRLWGGAGNDTLSGGAGDDWLWGGPGVNEVAGALGIDTVGFEAPRRWTSLGISSVGGGNGTAREFAGTATSAFETTTYMMVETFAFLDGRLVFDPADPAMQVWRLFQGGLGRAPDPVGLNAYVAGLERGLTLLQAAEGVIASAEFAARFRAPDNAGFVTLAYQNVLGRAPDAPGFATWKTALDAGMSRAQLLTGFTESLEARARSQAALPNGLWDQDETVAQLARLYQAALGRRPDEPGMRNWEAALEGGMPLRDVAAAFTTSLEFQRLYGTPDNGAYITLLYRNVLDRAPDATGFANWLGALEAGRVDRPGALLGFSESLEFIQKSQSFIEGGVLFA